MKESKGKANPQIVNELLRKKLENNVKFRATEAK
jgi:Asp-tRNA(Asn)/Glu-tRNA(Gln) amidotransferase B subunit